MTDGTKSNGIDQSSRGCTAVVGLVLLLLAALLDRSVLRADDVHGCITSATLCLCESSDYRVSAAGMAVLDAGLSFASSKIGNPDDVVATSRGHNGGVDGSNGGRNKGRDNPAGSSKSDLERAAAACLRVASSSRVLGAVETLLSHPRDAPNNPIKQQFIPNASTSEGRLPHSSPSSAATSASVGRSHLLPRGSAGGERLDGREYGTPSRGMLDAPVSVLAHAITAVTASFATNGGKSGSHVVGIDSLPSHQQKTRETISAGSMCRKVLWRSLCEQLRWGGSGELSPRGLVSALRFAEGILISIPTTDFVDYLIRGGGVTGLLGDQTAEDSERSSSSSSSLFGTICKVVLGQRHLQAVAGWPHDNSARRAGTSCVIHGGIASVAAIVTASVGVLQVPLARDVLRDAQLDVQQMMHAEGLVAALLGSMRMLFPGAGENNHHSNENYRIEDTQFEDESRGNGGKYSGVEGGKDDVPAGPSDDRAAAEAALSACVDLLSRLVLLSPHFSAQFLEEQGLVDLASAGALLETSPATLATGALVIASQLARASPSNYAPLRAAGVDDSLGEVLSHSDSTVRAKACNLVGNLCRHSSFFYASLQQKAQRQSRQRLHAAGIGAQRRRMGERKSVVDHLVDLCTDPDPSTRKFACFAVGNAAFHSNFLYASLAPAVSPLVAALEDPEEKTRANAAGALGNLVRNGGALSTDLARKGSIGGLLRLAATDPAASPRRIALFSLGTSCAYVPCREALASVLSADNLGNDCLAGSGGGSAGRGSRRRSSGNRDFDGAGGPGRGGGRRQRWNLEGNGGSIFPATGGTSPALTDMLTELGRVAVATGDDVARKYVERLRTKLSAPAQG